MTLKTWHIVGLEKHVEDYVVIRKKYTTIVGSGSDKRLKNLDEICKGLSQVRLC